MWHMWTEGFCQGTDYFTGVVPLRSQPDVSALGRSARRDTESNNNNVHLSFLFFNFFLLQGVDERMINVHYYYYYYY